MGSTTWSSMGEAFRATRSSYWGYHNPNRCRWSNIAKAYLYMRKFITDREARLYISYKRIYRCLCLELWRYAWSRSSVSMHRLNIKQGVKLVNNSNDSSDSTSWRQLRLKFKNSSNVASFDRNSTQTGSLKLCPSLKRMKRSESVSTSTILI